MSKETKQKVLMSDLLEIRFTKTFSALKLTTRVYFLNLIERIYS